MMGDAAFREQLRRLAKAELHVHLDGSLRPGTLLELGAEYGVPMPAATPAGLRDYMHVRDARDLVDYLERFSVTLSVMQTAEALERIAYELAADMAAENVRYAEIRYAPILNTRAGLSLVDAVEAPLRGLRRSRSDFGIETRVILCAIRSMDVAVSRATAELTVAMKGKGVVGFDLAGPEHANPPTLHREACEIVRAAGMHVTIHAGEAAGPSSIREALSCGAQRIGHGTNLILDMDLLHEIRDLHIPIEICLSSNVQTRAVAAYSDHPLRRFFDEGVQVSLCTDNRLMSDTTVSNEYWFAHRHLGFTWAELVQIAEMGFVAAFTDGADMWALRASDHEDPGLSGSHGGAH